MSGGYIKHALELCCIMIIIIKVIYTNRSCWICDCCACDRNSDLYITSSKHPTIISKSH